jgi:hypothetical protein
MASGKNQFGVIPKLLDVFGLSDRAVGFDPKAGKIVSAGKGSEAFGYTQVGQDWESRKRDWSEMMSNDIIQAALNLYAEEATMSDHRSPATLWATADSNEITSKLITLLNRIGSEDVIFSQAWHVAALGNQFEYLEYHKNEGIVSTHFESIDNMERLVDEKDNLLGYRSTARTQEGKDDKFKPWDYLHMRRLGANRSTGMGEALVEPARSVFKKFSMVEGALMTYRLNMNPNRLNMDIHTGDSDPYNQLRILEDFKRTILANQYINQDTQEFKNIYQPPSFEAMLFSAKNSDDNSSLSVLQGDSKFPEIADYKVMFQRMAGALGIPPAYLGNESEVSAKNILIQEDVRFARKIISLRKALVTGYTRLCQIHLSMLDIDVKKVNFKIEMAPIAALDTQMRMEALGAQLDAVQNLASLGESFGLNMIDWFRYIFTEYMDFPKDVVEMFIASIHSNNMLNVDETSVSFKLTPLQKKLLEDRKNQGASSKRIAETLKSFISESPQLRFSLDQMKKNSVGFNYLNEKDLDQPLPERIHEVNS